MITSSQNPKLLHIKKLNSQKKYRDIHNQFVLENNHFISDTLTHHHNLINYIICTNMHQNIIELAAQKNISVFLCNSTCSSGISHVKESSGCFAVVNKPIWKVPEKPFDICIALTNIKNPANLGSIIRNANAFNCLGIYLLGYCCDPFHPESVRAAAGNVFNVPIVPIASIDMLKPYFCCQLDILAKKPIHFIAKQTPTCFIFGSEMGFKDSKNSQIQSFHIPMSEDVDSLNIAVSTGIVLYSYSTIFNKG